MTDFPIFMTVRLGVCATADAYRGALTSAGIGIDPWASGLLTNLAIETLRSELDIVRVSVSELGFETRATYKEISERGAELGLHLCPAETGPALRLAYQQQQPAELLRVAMAGIRDSDGDPCIFEVAERDGLWLGASLGFPEIMWLADSLALFVRPRRAAAQAATPYDEALRLEGSGELEAAHSMFEQARHIYSLKCDAHGEVQCLLKLIDYHLGMAEYDQALPLAEQALLLLRGIDAPRTLGVALLMRHWCAGADEPDRKRIQRLKHALALLHHHEEPLRAAAAHRALAQIERPDGRLAEARANYLQAIPLYEAGGSRLEGPATLHALAGLELDAQHAELACAYLEMAVERLNGVALIGARLITSRCFERLGDAWAMRGDAAQTRAYYQKAFDLCRQFEYSKSTIAQKLAKLDRKDGE